jgi:SAM-dependent methyltransferase
MEELFDDAVDYESMLDRGLQVTGEGKDYFMDGRLSYMRHCLPLNFSPKKILDFGCGTGETTKAISAIYPDATVLGVDTSLETVKYANANFGTERIDFQHIDGLEAHRDFDLAYVNGVFHHIPPPEREKSATLLYDSLRQGGRLAYFENNPWNPGTRWVMNRIPFDRHAITLSYIESTSLLKTVGFSMLTVHFLFYFPSILSFLRPLEKYMVRIPFGGQYMIMAAKTDKA